MVLELCNGRDASNLPALEDIFTCTKKKNEEMVEEELEGG
jgi:hypothetical protein